MWRAVLTFCEEVMSQKEVAEREREAFSLDPIRRLIGENKSYEGHKVYKIVPKTQEQANLLEDLRRNGIGELWDDNVVVNCNVRITVPAVKENVFLESVEKGQMKAELLIEDLQRIINEQAIPAQKSAKSSSFHSLTWDRYHTLDEIYAWLDELATAYPDIVTPVVMGRSVENREIKGIVINYTPIGNYYIGVIEGTLHAREWITTATATWVIKEFLTSTDPEVRFMAEHFVWHIFPVVNPDGYSYTFTNNRMWRKNRSNASFVSCEASGVDDDMSNGVDLNRNFDFVWMSVGASNNSCTNTYAGPAPFSEPESQAISEYVLNLKQYGQIIYYIAFHSYTQLVVVPYSHVSGFDVLTANNYGDMYEIGIRGAAKLREKYGTNYRVGVSADIMYPMSGTSFDWVKYAANVPITYLIEMRDMGHYGFLLPADQIIPNSEEVMDFLLEMDRTTRSIGYYRLPLSSAINFKAIKLFVLGCIFFTHFAITTFIGVFSLTNAGKSYNNYKVYNVIPKSEVQVQYLTDLRKEGYDFWTDVIDINKEVRIMVSPEQADEFVKYSTSVGMEAELSINNVQELIEAQMKPAKGARSASLGSFTWDSYHSLEAIYSWLDELVELYPNVVTTVNIGSTHEGRQIKGVVIDFQGDSREAEPLIAMIEGGIHAREWISPATVTWIIKEFLTSQDSDVRFLAEAFVWHIFPVVNPDGYAYTFAGDRMWRKNRNPANFVACSPNEDLGNGIDLNRNFNFVWMSIGASNDSCTQTYAGSSASSELEARAISNYVLGLKNNGKFLYYFAFHSYSQMILVPYSHVYGYGVLEAENYADMYEIAIRGAEKLTARHGTQYTVGTSAEILYPVSGSSFDWVKGVADIPIVYLFELRDLGQFGFLLPSDQIILNNEEIVDCLVEMDKTTRLLGYYYYSSSATVNSLGAFMLMSLIFLVIF
ncbi:uncharacterized protein ACR2FA_005409 [Aphomia sociella]